MAVRKLQQAEARNNANNANNDQDKKNKKGKGKGGRKGKSGRKGKNTKKGKEKNVTKGKSDNNDDNDDEVEWDGDIGGTCNNGDKAKCDNIEAKIIHNEEENNKDEGKQSNVSNKGEQSVDNKLGSKHHKDCDDKGNCDESEHDKHSNNETETLDKVHTLETPQEILPKTFKYGLTLVSLSNEALEIRKTMRK